MTNCIPADIGYEQGLMQDNFSGISSTTVYGSLINTLIKILYKRAINMIIVKIQTVRALFMPHPNAITVCSWSLSVLLFVFVFDYLETI